MIKIHHVVSDAWTAMLLANQFFSLLKGESIQGFDYADYVENERNIIQAVALNAIRPIWNQSMPNALKRLCSGLNHMIR